MANPQALLEAASHLDSLPRLGRRIRALSAAAMTPRSEVLFVNLHPDDLLDSELVAEETPLAQIASRVILEVRPTGLARENIPAERRVWESLPSIPAVRTGRIHIVIDDYLVTPGPRVAQAAETIARIIHPEAFK